MTATRSNWDCARSVSKAANSPEVITASGLNSAVARTGGLIATALTSVVLAARGDALMMDDRVACLLTAGCALTAAAAAFVGSKDKARS